MNDLATSNHRDADNAEARDILCLAGGAALIILGAGVAMTHPVIRRNVKAALGALVPQVEGPLRSGVQAALPDIERYLRLKGM